MTHPGLYVLTLGVTIGAAILALFLANRTYQEEGHQHRSSNSTNREFVDGGNNCTICLEQIPNDWSKSILECGHTFHGKCIQKWIRQKSICPNCNMPTQVVI